MTAHAKVSVLFFAVTVFCSYWLTVGGYALPDHSEQESQSSGKHSKLDLSKVKCIACKVIVSQLQSVYFLNVSQEYIATLVRKFCVTFKIEDNFVCKGIANMFQDEVLYVLGKLILNPNQVCSVLVPDCASPFDPFFSWNVTFPPVPKPPVEELKLPPKGSPTLKVLHLTDVHWDPLYKAGSEVDCGEPLCCRNITNTTSTRKAGKWGSIGSCDSPLSLITSLFEHLSKQKFDYILLTGDLPPHDVWKQNRNGQLQLINKLLDLIFTYFPKTPVFPALGNHESSPVNSFPPHYPNLPPQFAINWLYDNLSQKWATWVPSKIMKKVIRGLASYEVDVTKNLRIISLNTNYCNNENFWLLLNQSDPDAALQWLIERLQDAETNGKKVHIIGHIPPGYGSCLPQWSKNYYNIMNRYENTVRGQFFGHTHFDTFSVFYEDCNQTKRPTNVMYIAPSVTTSPFKNPGYRLYTIDGEWDNSTYAVLDHDSFFLNITKADIEGQPVWEHLYNARDAYGMTSLFPADWNNLIGKLQRDDVLFNETFAEFYTGASPYYDCTTYACKRDLLCHMRSARSYYPELCSDLLQ